jgi:hypothetical protein
MLQVAVCCFCRTCQLCCAVQARQQPLLLQGCCFSFDLYHRQDLTGCVYCQQQCWMCLFLVGGKAAHAVVVYVVLSVTTRALALAAAKSHSRQGGRMLLFFSAASIQCVCESGHLWPALVFLQCV